MQRKSKPYKQRAGSMPPNETFDETLERPLTVDDIDAAVSKLPIEVDPPAKIGMEQLLKDRQALSDDNTQLQNELMELKSKLATKQELDALIKPYAGKATGSCASIAAPSL